MNSQASVEFLMTAVEIAIYVWIVTGGLATFASLLFLGTRYASPRRLGWSLILFGCSILAALGRMPIRLLVFGERAEGVIEQLIPKRKTGLRPAVRFVTADGAEARFVCRQGVSGGVYSVGDTMPVYYLPSDPSFGVVATRPSLWFPTGFGLLFAAVPLGLGGYLVRKYRLRSG
jgi:Protein of unknown function (DUF3592)